MDIDQKLPEIRQLYIKQRLMKLQEIISDFDKTNPSEKKKERLLVKLWKFQSKVEFILSFEDICLLYKNEEVSPQYYQYGFNKAQEIGITQILNFCKLLENKNFEYNKESIFYTYNELIDNCLNKKYEKQFDEIIINTHRPLKAEFLVKYMTEHNNYKFLNFLDQYGEHLKWSEDSLKDFTDILFKNSFGQFPQFLKERYPNMSHQTLRMEVVASICEKVQKTIKINPLILFKNPMAVLLRKETFNAGFHDQNFFDENTKVFKHFLDISELSSKDIAEFEKNIDYSPAIKILGSKKLQKEIKNFKHKKTIKKMVL